jgi:hypothetical protein
MDNQKVEQVITEFFSIVEREVQNMEYGTMTVNVQVGSGLPITQTLNIVKSKRIRYKVDTRREE